MVSALERQDSTKGYKAPLLSCLLRWTAVTAGLQSRILSTVNYLTHFYRSLVYPPLSQR
jgi:hypothetical protein